MERPSSVHRLLVTLRDTSPPIWRRLEIDSEASLTELHELLQAAFGWFDCHLHEFQFGDVVYGVDPDDGRSAGDPPDTRLDLLAATGACFTYRYDFGDNWELAVEVESVDHPDLAHAYPRCDDGRRAGPPEDCGGAWGYAELVDALGDASHPDHVELIAWLGHDFDPEHFEPSEVNAVLGTARPMLRLVR